MNPLLQTAMKIATKTSPKFLQALSTRQGIMKQVELAKMRGACYNVVKNLETAYKMISQKMHKIE